jgi:hypothetical protein
MRKVILLLLVFVLTSCEQYVTEMKDVTLSGKYVISKLEITNVDQNQTRDSLYLVGTTYINPTLPHPFNNISINNTYIHFDYSTVKMSLLGVTNSGQDIWQYGNSPNEIFYRLFGGTPYNSGYLQYDYTTINGMHPLITFMIEDDGLESLQLKSSGAWFNGKFGQKQVMTLSLTRVGP